MKIARYSPMAKIPHGVRYANLLSLGERCVESRLSCQQKEPTTRQAIFVVKGGRKRYVREFSYRLEPLCVIVL